MNTSIVSLFAATLLHKNDMHGRQKMHAGFTGLWKKMPVNRFVSALMCVLALCVLSGSPAQAENPNASLMGRWKITRIVNVDTHAGSSSKMAQELLGQTMIIAPNSIRLSNHLCPVASYGAPRQYEEKFPRGQFNPAKLGLSYPTAMIDAGCTSIFPQNAGHIVVHWKGIFFAATKQQIDLAHWM